MDDVARRQAVESFPAFEHLDPRCLEWLATVVTPRTFRSGDVLINEHSNTRECYFILSGRTEDTKGGSPVGKSAQGDIEGEIALLFETPRSATVRAVEPTQTLVLSQRDFDDVAHTQRARGSSARGDSRVPAGSLREGVTTSHGAGR